MLLATVVAPRALAQIDPGGGGSGQGGIPTWVEYNKRVAATQRISPLKASFAGEHVSLYNGATSFSVTDIDVPGNSALPVQLVRHLAIQLQPLDPYQTYDTLLHGAGNWDVDVPYMAATYATSTGGWNADRCSLGSVPDTVMGPDGAFLRAEVWQGITIHVPGRGDTTALGLDTQTPVPSSGGPYHLTTTNRDVFDCIPMKKSGLSGEGFRMTTPSGLRYYFDVGAVRTASKLVKYIDLPDDTPGKEAVFLARDHYYLLASKIEDRFGNNVQIQYNADGHPTRIWSSDGREIDLYYSDGRLSSATTSSGRTWHYHYDASGNLSDVVLPDSSKWQYAYTGTLKPQAPPPYETLSGPWCTGMPAIVSAEFTLTATGPSGAVASFRFDNTRHDRSGVHASECMQEGNPADPTYDLLVPYFYDVMSLTQKTLSGPGLPDGGPGLPDATWNYGYANASFGLWGTHTEPPNYPCTTCTQYKTVTVMNPDGTEKRYRFGIEYWLNDGRLLQTDTLDTDGHVIRTVANEYLSDSAAASEPFYAEYGNVLGGVADPVTARIRPVTKTTITQDQATFTTSVNSFDDFARTTSKTETGTGIATYDHRTKKTVTTAYYDDLKNWVLGQVWSTSTLGNAIPCSSSTVAQQNPDLTSCTVYDTISGTDLPLQTYKFGKLVSKEAWNSDGTLANVKDGNGNTTQFSGWHRGLPQAVQFADHTSESAHVDDNGWITSVTVETDATTDSKATTGYQYDPMGRLKEIDYPTDDDVGWNKTHISFGPTGAGQYNTPAGTWVQTIQTGNAVTNTYFDALWRPLVTEHYDNTNATTKAATLSQVTHLYDVDGRTIFTSYPSNDVTNYLQSVPGTYTDYDALNRVIEVDQDSELGTLKTFTQYQSGFQTRVTDPNNKVTTTKYYAWGSPDTSLPYQITSEIDASHNEITTITRDIFGKPVWIARNGTNHEAFIYDANQQLCKRITAGVVSFYNWDPAGNLNWSASGVNWFGDNSCDDVNTTNATGHEVDRAYDARNRLKELVFPENDNEGNQAWYYTPDGLPSKIVTDNGTGPQVTNSYLYDKRRLMISEALTVGNQFTWAEGYGYDANGHLSVRFTPSGQYYAKDPDALGQPTDLRIENVNTYVYNVSHYPDGHISSFTWTNGLTHQVTENVRGLPSEIHDSMSGNDAEDLSYTYDADGNTTHITDSATSARTSILAYDGLDRLTSAAIAGIDGNLPTRYQYNALDQITEASQGTHTRTFTYGTAISRGDWLLSVSDNQTGETDYGYDAQGNLASRGGVAYTFDVGNRLRNVAGEEGGYAYDGYGRRVAQTTNEGTIYSFYDHGGHLIYQRGRDGWSHDYLYLGGKLVAIRDYDTGGIARGLRYQDTDALGSVIRQTDKDGNEYPGAGTGPVYDAWGKMVSGSVQDAPGYTGHVEDSSTGLVYMQQRYYDPNVGRFLSMDPVDANGTNGSNLDRYWYANDNPYRYTDPTGMCTGTLLCNSDGTTAAIFGGGYTTGLMSAALAMRARGTAASHQNVATNHQSSGSARGQGRVLTQGESDAAHSELPDLKTDPVRIKYDLHGNAAYTPNNTMHFPSSMAYCQDFSSCNHGDEVGWFIHEITHVWQYQHGVNPFWGHIFSRDLFKFGNYLPLNKYLKTASPNGLPTEEQADWHMWHYECTHGLQC